MEEWDSYQGASEGEKKSSCRNVSKEAEKIYVYVRSTKVEEGTKEKVKVNPQNPQKRKLEIPATRNSRTGQEGDSARKNRERKCGEKGREL